MPNSNSTLVYSSEQGRICPACGKAQSGCQCRKGKKKGAGKTAGSSRPVQVPQDGVVRILRETKGRKGKGVSLITGIPAAQQKDVAKSLKQKCGCGGSVKNGVIEVQTDNRDLLQKELSALGFKAKQAGG